MGRDSVILFRTGGLGRSGCGWRMGAGVGSVMTTSMGINSMGGIWPLSAARRAAKINPAKWSRTDANRGIVKGREVMGISAPPPV